MSHNSRTKRPNQPDMYRVLFGDRMTEEVLQIISNGIVSLCSNAKRLLDDAKILASVDRFTTATFLLATADEEAAKVYILLDMARLDFTKRQEQLRRLCNAFYDHVLKRAYIEVTRFGEFWDMQHVKEVVDTEKIRWFKGDFEYGEPDMPGRAKIFREWSLYVDFSEYDDNWFSPRFDKEMVLGWGSEEDRIGGLLNDVEKSIGRLEETRDAGLFSLECLQIFHEVFSQVFITSKTTREEIYALYNRFLKRLEAQGVNLSKTLRNDNALIEWPLYALI